MWLIFVGFKHYELKNPAMKAIKILFIALLATSIVSCESDDDAAADTSASILGIWNGVDVDYSGTTTTNADGFPPIEADFIGETTDVDFTLDFTEDPNEVTSDGSYTIELTTTILGETTTDTQNIEFLQDGTWSRSGDILTITSEGVSQDYTIEELTESTLIFSAQVEEELGDPDLGVSIITMIDLRAVLSR